MALYILLCNVTHHSVQISTEENGWLRYFQSYEAALKFAEENQLKDYNIFKKKPPKAPKK
ncbi:hypothetical protein [Larkinella terrae]|uniref:Uncharacterized protein n=1 Tax=Larkinella terrae TaxID=2025311 RepID=A0A7K0EM74_9BACT|nr:hypothetical protein [Larkinella terrae]MRS62812.1 hypothetical protein [Larkinella terrae]